MYSLIVDLLNVKYIFDKYIFIFFLVVFFLTLKAIPVFVVLRISLFSGWAEVAIAHAKY
jgi:hypothetical protein